MSKNWIPYFTARVSKTFLHFISHSTGGKAKFSNLRGCKMTLKNRKYIFSYSVKQQNIFLRNLKLHNPAFLSTCVHWLISAILGGGECFFDFCSILFHLIIYFNTVCEATDYLICVSQLLSHCAREHKWHNAHFVKCFSWHWTDTGGRGSKGKS